MIEETFDRGKLVGSRQVERVHPGSPTGMLQTVFDLFGPEPRNAYALTPDARRTPNVWEFPGSALSASVHALHFHRPGVWADVVYARWLVVWTPAATTSELRLVSADGGPSNIVEMAALSRGGVDSPVVATVNVTTAMQTLAQSGKWKQIGHQIKATSTDMLVYLSRVEVVWSTG